MLPWAQGRFQIYLFIFRTYFFFHLCHTEANFAGFINIYNVYYVFQVPLINFGPCVRVLHFVLHRPPKITRVYFPQQSGCARLNIFVRVTLSQLGVQKTEG